jgi:hypothetical protein
MTTTSNRGASPYGSTKSRSADKRNGQQGAADAAPAKGIAVQAAPQSWDLEHWPAHVYPHDKARARYLIRAHKCELIAAGALARIGREFVIIGMPYTRWLQKQTTRAAVYDIAPNRASRIEGEAA